MPAAIVPAALKHIHEALHVGIHIGVRIDQRITHARLRGEMHHLRKFIFREERSHRLAFREIELDESKSRQLGELGKPRLFQPRIVIVVDVVEADDFSAVLQQPACDMKADEAGRARYQDCVICHGSQPPQIDAGGFRRRDRAGT